MKKKRRGRRRNKLRGKSISRDGPRSTKTTTMTKGQEVKEEKKKRRRRRARAQEEEVQDQRIRKKGLQYGLQMSGKDGKTGAPDTRNRESRTTKVGVAVT